MTWVGFSVSWVYEAGGKPAPHLLPASLFVALLFSGATLTSPPNGPPGSGLEKISIRAILAYFGSQYDFSSSPSRAEPCSAVGHSGSYRWDWCCEMTTNHQD